MQALERENTSIVLEQLLMKEMESSQDAKSLESTCTQCSC